MQIYGGNDINLNAAAALGSTMNATLNNGAYLTARNLNIDGPSVLNATLNGCTIDVSTGNNNFYISGARRTKASGPAAGLHSRPDLLPRRRRAAQRLVLRRRHAERFAEHPVLGRPSTISASGNGVLSTSRYITTSDVAALNISNGATVLTNSGIYIYNGNGTMNANISGGTLTVLGDGIAVKNQNWNGTSAISSPRHWRRRRVERHQHQREQFVAAYGLDQRRQPNQRDRQFQRLRHGQHDSRERQ